MDNKLHILLLSLDDEIEKKCFEIKEQKKEQAFKKLFGICCIVFLILPIVAFMFGMQLLNALITLAIFNSIFILVVFPLIFSNKTEVVNNEYIR